MFFKVGPSWVNEAKITQIQETTTRGKPRRLSITMSGRELPVEVAAENDVKAILDWLGAQGVQKLAPAALGSSDSVLVIGVGEKTFATQIGHPYKVGDRLRFSSASNPDRYMDGAITSYHVHELQASIDWVSPLGGTYSDWVFSVPPNVPEVAPEIPAPKVSSPPAHAPGVAPESKLKTEPKVDVKKPLKP